MKLLLTQTPAIADLLPDRLLGFERIGRYEDGLLEFSDDWANPTYIPDLSRLSELQSARILLRFASLLGYEGHTKKIDNSQIRSRNFLTSARDVFIATGDVSGTAESECYIALSYWRTGELNEADSWIEEALSHNLPSLNKIRLFCFVTRTLINLIHQRFDRNIQIGLALEQSFYEHGDDFLTASFLINLGVSYKNLDCLNEASRCLEIARHFHQRSGHKAYLGITENNLAQLYKKARNFTKAHSTIDSACNTFSEIGDITREGFAYDTKALIYIDERKYEDALMTVEKAVNLLKGSENSVYLSETLLTEAKILLYLDNFRGAVTVLIDAVETARINGGESAAALLIGQFEDAVNEKNSAGAAQNNNGGDIAAPDLEIVLPAELAHYEDYSGIWIRNTHLESIGICRGSLAIIVNEQVNPGDLAAIAEIESGEVSCGFYDCDFGIVCLDGCASDPQLFDESAVKILGKIVGFCNSGDQNGRMTVKALNL